MIYKLQFHELALIEWNKLDKAVREQFKKKLEKRLLMPQVEKDRVHGITNAYKIKLRSAGFRLVYKVEDSQLVVYVLSAGKRERHEAYLNAIARANS